MAISGDRRVVATGQVASALDGSADCPYVCVWDPLASPPAQLQRLDFPSEGSPSRWGFALQRKLRLCLGV